MSPTIVSNNYLSLLLPAFKHHGGKPVFRPIISPSSSWGIVTFQECSEQIEAARLHWASSLGRTELRRGSVTGVWLTGRKWTDLINIISLSAAGYVPQLFSSIFSTDVVQTLLKSSGAKALIYDAQEHPDVSSEFQMQAIPALEASDLDRLLRGRSGLPGLTADVLCAVEERAAAVIFHSSGTTSGVPKLIPTSHLLLKTFILHKFPDCLLHGETDPTSSIFNSLGSLAHVGSFQAFLGAAAHGCCTVQSSSMALPSSEMLAMIRECGLNRLVQYATFVSGHIRTARIDSSVRQALQGLHQILYTGVALDAQDSQWAFENDLRITSMYGTSETAPLMVSRVGSSPSARLLRPCQGASPIFVPHSPSEPEAMDASRPPLYEIIVAADAPDAPPYSLLSADGFWHTGDLFERVLPSNGGPAGWIHRGRSGDWIKTSGGFVDTKSIEDAVRRECSAVVFDAVVVGASRTHPVLIVESHLEVIMEKTKRWIALEVVKKTAAANKGMFPYERVTDSRWVIVVGRGALPRTKEKGNVRRNAAEAIFKAEIDTIFDV